MRIVQITPGTGSFHCGSCLRDMVLVKALRKRGHEVLLLPMYLPLITEEPIPEQDVFFGGVNVYLQQQSRLFRHTPGWLDRWLDRPGLLRRVAGKAHLTSPQAQGELMLSMLAGAEGRQTKELDRLVACLQSQPRPDLVVLSNALLLGCGPVLQQRLKVKVVATLQGEDTFVDRLPPALCRQAWDHLSRLASQADGLIAISRYYQQTMARRLKIDPSRIDVVYNGIETDLYERAEMAEPPTHPPVIGYLARMCPDKGLHTLVQAFVQLRQRGRVPEARLLIVGAQTPGDRSYVQAQRELLHQQGLLAQTRFEPNVTRSQKIQELRSMSVLSVPATYGEAFGLYVLEALAMGVPVVQPRHGAFPELLEQTGGGWLCEPDDAMDLAEKLETLLCDSVLARQMGTRGCAAVRQCFTMQTMADNVLRVYARIFSQVQAGADTTHGGNPR